MQNFNEAVFAAVNATENAPVWLVDTARFFAEWVIFVFALALVLGWVRGGAKTRRQLFVTAAVVVLALLFNGVISRLWYHPRPFEVGLGRTLLDHGVDSSFPSDHASVVFAVAFGLFVAHVRRFWSVLALVLACGVAWSRVYLGVHWPLDMAGSFVVAAVSAGLVRGLVRLTWMQALREGALLLYDRILDLLHIPAAISPRST